SEQLLQEHAPFNAGQTKVAVRVPIVRSRFVLRPMIQMRHTIAETYISSTLLRHPPARCPRAGWLRAIGIEQKGKVLVIDRHDYLPSSGPFAAMVGGEALTGRTVHHKNTFLFCPNDDDSMAIASP